jgi:hypothetical protein
MCLDVECFARLFIYTKFRGAAEGKESLSLDG